MASGVEEYDPQAAAALSEAVAEIQTELVERLGPTVHELSDRDQIAIRTAVQKAAALGYGRGIERVSFELIDKCQESGIPLAVDISPDVAHVRDGWAERYG